MATIAPRGTSRGRIKPLDEILATAEKKSLKRSLGAFQLTLLGIGAVIGTGIFVLTATAAQKAGPGMMVSFIVAGTVCALAALCYSELASMVPVAGSAYTYSYAVMGEIMAWMVGWALILEYALGASAVAVGWSGFMSGLLDSIGIHIPHALKVGPPIQWGFLQGGEIGGMVNLPAVLVVAFVTTLLVIGTKESAHVQCSAGGYQGDRPDPVPDHHLADGQRACEQFRAVRAARLGQSVKLLRNRDTRRRGLDLLRLCRLRRRVDGGRGDQEPAAQRSDRADRQPSHLHGLLSARRRRRGRRLRRSAAHRPRDGPRVQGRFARTLCLGRLPGRQRAYRLLEGSARAHPAAGVEPAVRQSRRPRGGAGIAIGGPADDVRPDPHLLRHGSRRAAARGPVEGPPSDSARRTSSPSSPASSSPSRRHSCRSAPSPIIRTPAPCSPSQRSRSG